MYCLRSALILLFAGLLWGPMGTPVHAQQLLLNRSCESTTSGDVSDWTEDSGDWTCTDNTDANPQDGSLYFYMEESGLLGQVELRQDVTGEGGTAYRFSAQMQTNDDDEGAIVVQYLDGGGTVLEEFSTGDNNSNFVDTNGSWETKQDLREAPEETQTVRIKLRVVEGVSANQIRAYFDDLRLIGKLQIVEVMQNPSDVSDSDGEYVELYNSTASDVSVDGWTLNGHSISSVTVPARGVAVLCRNSTADQNGGVETCDDELSSLSLGDDTDTITLQDGNGITIDEISYNAGSSGWPDPSGESMVFTAVTGTNTGGNWSTAPRRERGFRLDESGDLGSPGRTGTDQSMQPTAAVSSGSAGWQMLSAPASGVDADILAQANLVQGFSGHFPNQAVNLYQWPGGPIQTGGGSDDWEKPSGPGTDLTSNGMGYIWYVFGSTGTSKTDTPPFTMSTPGEVRTTDVTTNSLQDGFYLLGNPYGMSFDLSGLDLGANDFSTTVQVWDPSDDTYKTVTRDDQNSNDLLSAYQGFFVERSSGSTGKQLTFSFSGRTSSSESLKNIDGGLSRIGFRLTGHTAEGDTLTQDHALTLQTRTGASLGWDVHDASKLTPLSGSPYATAAFRGIREGESVLQAVMSVPQSLPQDSVGLPVALNMSGAGAAEDFTLAWPEWSQVPDDWHLTLHDTTADTTVDLRDQSSYTFTVADEKQSRRHNARGPATGMPDPQPPRPPSPRRAKASSDTSRFTLTIQSDPIPVELTRIEATLLGRRATLEWTTASETDNAGFHVEHRGPEGESFTPLGFVEGHGTTQTPHAYRYRTDPLDPGTHTFRLRQVDTDGTEHRSRAVDVKVGLDASYTATIQPHPVTTSSTLELAVRQRQQVRVTAYDLLGRRVGTLVDRTLPANETRQIPLHPGQMGMTSGTYLLRISGDTFEGTERLVVVR